MSQAALLRRILRKKSGDRAPKDGRYLDHHGCEVALKQNERMPNCPRDERPTTWRYEKLTGFPERATTTQRWGWQG